MPHEYSDHEQPVAIKEEAVNHPAHYGGADNVYEAIKVIEAWGLGFCLGNAIKYICRAGMKGDRLEDLKKARWYLDREIAAAEAAAENKLAIFGQPVYDHKDFDDAMAKARAEDMANVRRSD